MKRRCPAALAVLAALVLFVEPCLAGQTPRLPLEVATYLTGAWFAPAGEAQRTMYLKGGFTMVPYTPDGAAWAAEKGMVFIGGVNGNGLPPEAARPFESADGAQSMSVGLFTHINFNAPSVAEWWRTRVPELVRTMPYAERIQFWKVHNEFGYHSAGLFDYSPGSIERYHEWLGGRYAKLGDLNAAWHTQFTIVDEIAPPRTRDEMIKCLGNWLEWRRFTCWNFADYFRTTGNLIRSVQPGAAVSDNFYTTDPLQGWDNFELARQADYLAYDIYSAGRWPGLLEMLEQARSAASAWGKPFIIMEYHAGPNNWNSQVTYRDLTIEAATALSRECRALQWFRWIPDSAGREQGIHGMMDSRGRPTERFTAAAETSAFCQRLAPLLARSRTVSETALLTGSDASYLAYAKGGGTWESRQRWDRFSSVLAKAGIQCDQINPKVVTDGDISRYAVVIAGHLPVLGTDVLKRLHAFADAGGTVIMHPDVGLLDAYGQPRGDDPYTEEAVADGPWQARKRRDGATGIVVQRMGNGHILYCPWEMPPDRVTGDVLQNMMLSYATLLDEYAGVRAAWSAEGQIQSEQLDARLLSTGTGLLLFGTWLGQGNPEVTFTVPTIRAPCRAYMLSATNGSVRPLAGRLTDGGLRLSPVILDPAVVILIANQPWQPLVGIEAPKTLYPGQSVSVTVTVDNIGQTIAGGEVLLRAPAEWTVQGTSGPTFADLPSGGRVTAKFRVSVPENAALDNFAVEYPLVASVVFNQGYVGTLGVRHLPFVKPLLDVRLSYEGRELNPWQELTPSILRWGWDQEVRIPPPPPVSSGAPCIVSATVRVAPQYLGKSIDLRVLGAEGAAVSPTRVPLNYAEGTVPLTFSLPTPGTYTLVATCGPVHAEAPFEAGVHTDTVAAATAAAESTAPAGWRLLGTVGVGFRGAPGRGVPVRLDLPSAVPDVLGVRAFAASGDAVASCVGGREIALAADGAADTVTTYRVCLPEEGTALLPAERRVEIAQPDDTTVMIRGDTYTICFDTDYGVVRWLETLGQRSVRYRTGLVAVAEDGRIFAPGADGVVEGMTLAGSAIEGELSFTRRQQPFLMEETWHFTASRIEVAMVVANDGSAPITCTSLAVEIGADPKALPLWQRLFADGREEKGVLPSGFGPAAGAKVVDLCREDGTGLAIRLGRCALMTKWQSGFAGVQHNVGSTQIILLRGVRFDPGDRLLAEFSLIPHGSEGVTADIPVTVTAWRPSPD